MPRLVPSIARRYIFFMVMQRSTKMPVPRPAEPDDRVILHGIGWAQYEAIRDATDHIAGLHLTYLDGTLEIMRPSSRHERIKKLIARLVEAYAEELDLTMTGFGSTTYRRPEMQRALEPDECYVFGVGKEEPDIAIEVVITGGGIDKLAVYRGLGVKEVWFWVDGRVEIHQLGEAGYERSQRSRFLPDLDPEELAGIIASAGDYDQTQVVKRFRTRLAERRARL